MQKRREFMCFLRSGMEFVHGRKFILKSSRKPLEPNPEKAIEEIN